MVPIWLHDISIIYLICGGLSAALIAAHLFWHPQPMWIMNIVWPVTAAFGTGWIVWQYFVYGRHAPHAEMHGHHGHGPTQHGAASAAARKTPFPIMVANGALHCGSGCTLGDIVAEWLVFAVPAIAVWFGYKTLFVDKIFAVWIVDYIFAYLFGVFFQYFTIAPMRGLSFGAGVAAAIKADTFSLTAWQVGMYGFMAIGYFYVFGTVLHVTLRTNMVEFWFMMQIAMIFGFITTYPVNWWLLRRGMKEPM